MPCDILLVPKNSYESRGWAEAGLQKYGRLFCIFFAFDTFGLSPNPPLLFGLIPESKSRDVRCSLLKTYGAFVNTRNKIKIILESVKVDGRERE